MYLLDDAIDSIAKWTDVLIIFPKVFNQTNLPIGASMFQRQALVFLVLQQIALFTSSLANERVEVDKFESSDVQIEDRFREDTLKNYKIAGEVTWSNVGPTVSPKASLGIVQTVDASFQYEIDIWPGELGDTKRSVSQIRLYLSNHWQLIVTIHRVGQHGKIYRQVTVTEVDGRNQSSRHPKATELRRSPPFTLPGAVERWAFKYHYGVLEVFYNGKTLGTSYSSAFTSWLHGLFFVELAQEVTISRLKFAARSIGYSEQQRRIYNQINAIRQEAAAAQQEGNVEHAAELELNVIPLALECFGFDNYSIGLAHRAAARRFHILGLDERARSEYQQCAVIFEKSLGVEHPETLLNRMYLAELTALSKLSEGANAMKKAFVSFLRIVGSKSPNTLAMAKRLAVLLKKEADEKTLNGSYVSAQNSLEEVRNIYQNVYGEDHWITELAQFDLDFAIRLQAASGEELDKLKEYVVLLHKARRHQASYLTPQYKSQKQRLFDLTQEIFGAQHPYMAGELVAMAIDRFNQGRMGDAERMLRQGSEIYRSLWGEENPKYLTTLGLLGSHLSMTQRYDEATALLERADELMKEQKLDHLIEYADLKLSLGRHLIRVGKQIEADKHLTKALQLYKSNGKQTNPNALKTCERLADIWRAQQNIEKAEFYLDYQRNIVLATYGDDSAEYVDILLSEGTHLYMRRKFEEAVQKYQDAAQLAEKFYGKHSRAYEAIVDQLIKVHLFRNDMPALVRHFEERLEFEINRRESLFNVYSEEQQFQRSLRDLNSLDALVILALEGHMEPRRAYYYALAFKGAVTARQRSSRIAARTPEIREKHEILEIIESRIAISRETGSRSNTEPSYDQLVQKRDQLKTQLFEMSSSYRAASARTRVGDLQKLLPHKVVLIDYFEYQKPKGVFDTLFSKRAEIGLVCFVLTRENDVQLIDLGSVEPIVEACGAWRAAMDAEPYYELKSNNLTLAQLTDQRGNTVRKQVWDPLAKCLSEGDTVIISPSLHIVACPFAALPSADGNTFLIEKFAFATLSTPRLLPELLDNSSKEPATRMLLVGDIDYDSSVNSKVEFKGPLAATDSRAIFQRLPAAELELEPIRRSFSNRFEKSQLKLLSHRQATEPNVRTEVLGARFLHFHTHGFCIPKTELMQLQNDETSDFNQPPALASGIALSGANQGILSAESLSTDGILWADEISDLDLSSAELVTLSACQTAIGNLVPGEGMLGAQRALYVAGARSSLTTLWAVNDQSTSSLMAEFYKYLWAQDLSKSRSLQQAMIHLLREYQRVDKLVGGKQPRHRTPPALWAGFVLHGDWR